MNDRLIGIEDAMEKNECGKKSANENLKATIPSKGYETLKTTRECGIFQLFFLLFIPGYLYDNRSQAQTNSTKMTLVLLIKVATG